MMCLAAMTASAQTARQSSDSLYIQKSYSQEQMLMPVNPTYLKHVSEAANWGRNWFIEAKGGASALPHFKLTLLILNLTSVFLTSHSVFLTSL